MPTPTETLTTLATAARLIPNQARRPALVAIGNQARTARKKAKLSLAETARRMQISSQLLWDLEAGNRQWTSRTLAAWEPAINNQPPPGPP